MLIQDLLDIYLVNNAQCAEGESDEEYQLKKKKKNDRLFDRLRSSRLDFVSMALPVCIPPHSAFYFIEDFFRSSK